MSFVLQTVNQSLRSLPTITQRLHYFHDVTEKMDTRIPDVEHTLRAMQ